MRVKLYVAAVALLATAGGVVAAASVPAPTSLHAASVGVLLVLVALSEWLNIRYYHNDEVHALNLMEGILATLIFVASGAIVVVVTAVGLLVANLLRRNPPLKCLFNAAQWVLAASVGAVVMHSLRPAEFRSASAMPVLLLVMALMAGINFVAISGVLKAATGRAVGTRDDQQPKTVLIGHAIGNLASAVTGICLAATYVWNPWALSVGVVVVIGMHAGGRANASLRADGMRLAGLQRATHALAMSMDSSVGLPLFLAEARLGFEVDAVQLVLLGDRGTTVHTCTGTVHSGYSVSHGPHELAEAIAHDIVEPVHLIAGDTSEASQLLAASGHSRGLAAPLRAGGMTIGVLFLFDRNGMEGFESGELQIADALAREIVGFLERVDLLGAIDEERRKLADILGATSDGIFSLEADGTITSWNAGLASMTGYAAEEVVGTRHFGLLRPRDPSGRDVHIERWRELIETPDALPVDLQIVDSQGQTVWLSCSYSRIPAGDNRSDVLVVVARNVTKARELDKLKDDFVAVVSHELRTPLVPIKGWAQTLLNRGERLSDDQRRTAVQSILAQAQKLESLVLNILEASRIEAGRADGDGVADVVSIASRLVDDSAASRPERVVRFQPPSVPCTVKGSAVWVERAVANLLANAIKYSPDNEPVDVAITAAGDTVVVAVTDRWPGIAGDAHERIFERFERLEETRTQTGTGLGLYITRRLARAMGGDVSVSSMPGAGSTFLLKLPMTAAPASTVVPEQRPQTRPPNVVNLR